MKRRVALLEAMLSGRKPIPKAWILDAKLGLNTININGTKITLGDAAADPVAAGEIMLNGADLKVFTGGVVKSLSNIGAGTPLTEFYAEIWLMPSGANATTRGFRFDDVQSGTPNTRVEIDGMANTAATEGVTDNNIQRRVIDFSRLTGFTVTFKADIAVSGSTGTFALRNFTDSTDLATISTSATTLTAVESSAITVPTAEKTVTFQGENTGATTQNRMASPLLRVKAG